MCLETKLKRGGVVNFEFCEKRQLTSEDASIMDSYDLFSSFS